MWVLVLGLVLFLGVHLVPTAPDLQGRLRAQLGDNAFRGAFSLVSVAGIALIAWGLGAARGPSDVQLWYPPVWTKHLAFVLVWIAFVLVVAAYIPSHIRDRAKHPMLAGVKLWAFAHLLANGNLSGLLFFGSFLAWAVYDRVSVKKRGAKGPLGDKRGGWGGDMAAVGLGSALYALMLVWGHPWLIGIRLVGSA